MGFLPKRLVAWCALPSMLAAGVALAGEPSGVPRMPMPIEVENTATHRWLNKPVLNSRLLDDMENAANWSHRGFGKMTFTTERARDD